MIFYLLAFFENLPYSTMKILFLNIFHAVTLPQIYSSSLHSEWIVIRSFFLLEGCKGNRQRCGSGIFVSTATHIKLHWWTLNRGGETCDTGSIKRLPGKKQSNCTNGKSRKYVSSCIFFTNANFFALTCWFYINVTL